MQALNGRREFYVQAQQQAAQGQVCLGLDLTQGTAALWRAERLLVTRPQASAAFWHKVQLPTEYACPIQEQQGRRLYFEPYQALPQLVVCGGGHVALAVVRQAQLLGFAVTVIEERRQFATAGRFPGAQVICSPYGEALSALSLPEAYYVLATPGPQYDVACLQQILAGPYVYIGMLGSVRRRAQVWQGLSELGWGEADWQSVHCPVGLELGAETPAEVALAILAQILPVFKAHCGGRSVNTEMMARLAQPGLEPCVMVAIVERRGTAPRNAGTRMLVAADGQCYGTIGGGSVEAQACRLAMEQLNGQRDWQLSELKNCGGSDAGTLTLLLETL